MTFIEAVIEMQKGRKVYGKSKKGIIYIKEEDAIGKPLIVIDCVSAKGVKTTSAFLVDHRTIFSDGYTLVEEE